MKDFNSTIQQKIEDQKNIEAAVVHTKILIWFMQKLLKNLQRTLADAEPLKLNSNSYESPNIIQNAISEAKMYFLWDYVKCQIY